MQNIALTSANADTQTILQLIIFRSGNEEFGVDINAVREIIKVGLVTPIPNSPKYIKGIINVRGEIVTIIDIKSRFNLDGEESAPKHIVVTKQEEGLFGLMVDEVSEVLRIQNNEIKAPPSIMTNIHKKYVTGVLTHQNRLIILLDLNKVLSQNDLLEYTQTGKRKKNNEKNKQNANQQDDE